MLAKILILTFFANVPFGEAWSYDTSASDGPANWRDTYPACSRNSQSPINIDTTNSEYDDNLPAVNRDYFNAVPSAMTVSNNGHTIQVDLTDGYTINDQSLLPFSAKAAQYHLHWGTASGSTHTGGSEHTVDGVRHFGELHIVHYNTKYADLTAALQQSDGLAVFGWFITVSYPQPNLAFGNVLDLAVELAQNENENGAITTRFSVESLLPPNLAEYYRYQGSLTTPACFESVTWTVFNDSIEISQGQANQLSISYLTTSSAAITDNYRPVQALNGRSVTKSRPLEQSGAVTTSPHVVTGILVMATSVLYLL